MPIQKIGSKWRYGKTGKLYPTKAQALKQMKAILRNGYIRKTK